MLDVVEPNQHVHRVCRRESKFNPRAVTSSTMIEVYMFRAIIVSLFAAGMTGGCANMQPVTAEDSYCITETGQGCSELEGASDCQPCPRTASAVASAVAPAALPARPD
jgi:hypothetical protein